MKAGVLQFGCSSFNFLFYSPLAGLSLSGALACLHTPAVVPSYTQSATYSTTAVTYSGKTDKVCRNE